MTSQADALVNSGGVSDDGKSQAPIDGIGTTLGPCSWPRWPGWLATTRRRIYPNPAVWDERAHRFASFTRWGQAETPHEALRPVLMPWATGWAGAAGTTDNGCLVDTSRDLRYGWEIQGMAPLSPWDRGVLDYFAKVNGLPLTTEYDYRCDGLAYRRPGVTPVGSQGPKWKADGLLTPAHLTALIPGPLSLVIFNAAFGTGAKAAPGGWAEHWKPGQPYPGHAVTLPEGSGPTMVDCWSKLWLDIIDDAIEQWLNDEKVPTSSPLRNSKRWYAINLRGTLMSDEDNREQPDEPPLQAAESGTWRPIVESVGAVNPTARKQWAARGVTSEAIANQLGRNLFKYGTLRDWVPA